MLAHATAKDTDDPAALDDALRCNQQAMACFPADGVPATAWSQRAELLRRLHREDEIQAAGPAATSKPEPLASYTWRAGTWPGTATTRTRCRSWRTPPGRTRGPSGRGSCSAAATTASGTMPPPSPATAPALRWRRTPTRSGSTAGWPTSRRGDFKSARADFDRAIGCATTWPTPTSTGPWPARPRATWTGPRPTAPSPWNWASAARAFTSSGPASGRSSARRTRRPVIGMRACPTNRPTRAVGRPAGTTAVEAKPSDPQGALADFDKALDCNPQYRPALVNKAYTLAEVLGRPADGAAVLEPPSNTTPIRSTFGRRGPSTWPSPAAGRTPTPWPSGPWPSAATRPPATRWPGCMRRRRKRNPEDRREAFRLLTAALTKGYGFGHLDTDPELDPVFGPSKSSRTWVGRPRPPPEVVLTPGRLRPHEWAAARLTRPSRQFVWPGAARRPYVRRPSSPFAPERTARCPAVARWPWSRSKIGPRPSSGTTPGPTPVT